jgi:hypothetical protein
MPQKPPNKTRTRTLAVPEDPVVTEVRKIRADLWREGGGTVRGLLDLVKQRQGPSKRKRSRASE